jgi:penicillin-binding protein 2
VSRSLRHPFGGSRHYLRPEKDRSRRPKKAKQPKMRPNRFSVEGVLDAPDSTASRPGLRMRVTGLIVLALFGLLGLRLWALTVLQAPAAAHAVSANQLRDVAIEPTRGSILDRYGNPLVNNQVVEQITLSRVTAAQYPAVIGRLAALIGETPAQVEAAITNQQYSLYKPVPVVSGTDAQLLPDILYIKEHPAEFPGVSSVATTERNYPQGELPGPAANGYPAAQALGYVGTINSAELKAESSKGYQAGDPYGQSGLEYQYETELRGTPGTQELEVDATGQVVGTVKTTPAVAGDNLVTNIDTNLQQVADNALASQIMTLRASTDKTCNNNAGCHPPAVDGAVVVMDPQTGAVYAMSSYPTYNPAEWVGGISTADYAALEASGAQNNYAILFTPGSTFKLNTATAALQDGLWPADKVYDDKGTFTIPGCQYGSTTCNFQNAPGDGALGDIDLSTALTVSDDDFFYNLGALFYDQSATYGQTPIQDQAMQYGLGELTGIDLPDEVQGRIDSQAERLKLHQESPTGFPNTTWYAGDNVEMAFGQGATVITPIEQAVAYSTFANGGTRYQPQVAAAVVTPSGQVVKRFAPVVTGHVTIAAQNYQVMETGFEGAVNSPHGTAYGVPGLATFPGGVAGKTGTADTEIGKEPTAWFVGWGPTSSAAQYVVVCVIDQAGYGATASAPVVGDIFAYLAAHPVTAPGIPPAQSVVQNPSAIALPTTTTTTTAPSTGAATAPSTGAATATTTTTATTAAPAG